MESEIIAAQEICDWLVVKVAEILEYPASDVDVNTHFTSLGMDSLSLLTLTGDLAGWLDRDLAAPLLLGYPTIASLAEHLARHEGTVPAIEIPQVPRDQPLPLTFSQARVLGYAHMGPEGDGNLISERFYLKGPLHLEALQRSIDEIVRRHEILRTTFARLERGAVQTVHPPAQVAIEQFDLSGAPDPTEMAARMIGEHANVPMKLEHGPLFRVVLLKLSADEYRLAFVMHHILCDAEALLILHEDLNALYGAFVRGEPSPLEEPRLQVGDFAVWQRSWLRKEGEAYESRLAWWRQHWSGVTPPPLQLPFLYKEKPAVLPLPEDCGFTGKIPQALVEKVKALGRQEAATPYVTFLAAFSVLLYQATGEGDLVIGTYVSDRTRTDARHLMGVFLSMLPLRIRIEDGSTFREVLVRTRETVAQATLHQELPFEELREDFQRAGKPVPDVKVIFQYVMDSGGALELAGLEVSRWRMNTQLVMPWGFHMNIVEGDTTTTHLGCDGNLYDPVGANSVLRQYELLLQSLADHPDRSLKSTLQTPDA